MNGIQVSHRKIVKNGRNIEGKTENHIPVVIPGVQATDHQSRALGDRKQTRAVGDQDLKVETVSPGRLQPFTEGKTTASKSSSRTSSSKTFGQSRAKAQFIHSFSERPKLQSLQTHESYESAMQKKSWRSGGLNYNCQTIRRCDNSRPNKNRYCITNIVWLCKTCRLDGFKVIQAKPNQLRRRGEVSNNSCTKKKIGDPFVQTIVWKLSKIAKN